MELIVVSHPKRKENEVSEVIRMFEMGLERFHLRKPGTPKKYIKEFIEQVPKKYRNRIIIHSNHRYAWKYRLGGIHVSKKQRKHKFRLRLQLMWFRMRNQELVITRSCHKLADLSHRYSFYNYVLLSPIFDSISVNSLSGGFSKRGLTASLENSPLRVFAMGGVEPQNLKQVADFGFAGAAVLGFIWSAESPSQAYQQCINSLKSLN